MKTRAKAQRVQYARTETGTIWLCRISPSLPLARLLLHHLRLLRLAVVGFWGPFVAEGNCGAEAEAGNRGDGEAGGKERIWGVFCRWGSGNRSRGKWNWGVFG